jgi:ABC-type uncharacterized transport system permease subunit
MWLVLGSGAAYMLAWLGQLLCYSCSWRIPRLAYLAMVCLGLVGHGILLYRWIDIGVGQNLSITNVVSMVSWLALVLALTAGRYVWLRQLRFLLLPVAGGALLLASLVSDSRIVMTSADFVVFGHVILGLLILAVALLVWMQAVVTLVQRWQLRSKKLFGWLVYLPPLQTTQRLLFHCIGWLFCLMTVDVLASIWWFSGMLGHTVWAMISSSFAWLVFGVVWFCLYSQRMGYTVASAWVTLAVLALLIV